MSQLQVQMLNPPLGRFSGRASGVGDVSLFRSPSQKSPNGGGGALFSEGEEEAETALEEEEDMEEEEEESGRAIRAKREKREPPPSPPFQLTLESPRGMKGGRGRERKDLLTVENTNFFPPPSSPCLA